MLLPGWVDGECVAAEQRKQVRNGKALLSGALERCIGDAVGIIRSVAFSQRLKRAT